MEVMGLPEGDGAGVVFGGLPEGDGAGGDVVERPEGDGAGVNGGLPGPGRFGPGVDALAGESDAAVGDVAAEEGATVGPGEGTRTEDVGSGDVEPADRDVVAGPLGAPGSSCSERSSILVTERGSSS